MHGQNAEGKKGEVNLKLEIFGGPKLIVFPHICWKTLFFVQMQMRSVLVLLVYITKPCLYMWCIFMKWFFIRPNHYIHLKFTLKKKYLKNLPFPKLNMTGSCWYFEWKSDSNFPAKFMSNFLSCKWLRKLRTYSLAAAAQSNSNMTNYQSYILIKLAKIA